MLPASPIRSLSSLLAAAALVLLAVPAAAVDGKIEINQTLALAGGVNGDIVADPPGFPVLITAPGSYVLTSDLSVSDPSLTAIQSQVVRVTIDMNGFSITGPGSGDGIGLSLSSNSIVTNGRVASMGGDGVVTGGQSRVEAVQATNNGGPGISVGFDSMIDRCQAINNGGNGFVAGIDSIVTNSIAYSNAGDGIQLTSANSIARGNTACNNTGDGIQAVSSGSLVTGNTANGNDEYGLNLGLSTAFSNNSLSSNTLGDADRGRSTGGNFCSDKSCSVHNMRRYFMSTSTYNGANAANAGNCGDGFHFAAIWEIWDTSGLVYDTTRGTTAGDAGEGPPKFDAWARTGWAGFNAPEPGRANCGQWTSSSSGDDGTAVKPALFFDDAATRINPWDATVVGSCASFRRIWCVEDD